MTRYVTRGTIPVGDDLDGDGGMTGGTHIVIHEGEGEPQLTGLLDAWGNPLYRIVKRNPIGFHVVGSKKGRR
jgi:hypothetical protein